MIRAKLTVGAVVPNIYGEGVSVMFNTLYDPEVPEDERFCKTTPSGYMTMWVTNPVAIEAFKIGKKFYVDFTEVE
jgi:hypothetical protein